MGFLTRARLVQGYFAHFLARQPQNCYANVTLCSPWAGYATRSVALALKPRTLNPRMLHSMLLVAVVLYH